MQIGTIGKALIAISAILMMYALLMPVAMEGSDVVNIHLIAQKNNTLIIAGVLFVGGIALFSVFKMKQTKEEELAKRQKDAEIRESAKNQVREVASRGLGIAVLAPNYFAIKGATWRSSLSRLATGLVFGMLNGALLDGLAGLIIRQIIEGNDFAALTSRMSFTNGVAWIGCVITIAYSFRSRPYLIVLRNVLSCIFFLSFLSWGCDYLGYMDSGGRVFAIISMLGLIAIQFKLKRIKA